VALDRADGRKVDGRRVVVDYERGRTRQEWVPRRLGGGKGDKRRDRDTERLIRDLKKTEAALTERSRSRSADVATKDQADNLTVKEEVKASTQVPIIKEESKKSDIVKDETIDRSRSRSRDGKKDRKHGHRHHKSSRSSSSDADHYRRHKDSKKDSKKDTKKESKKDVKKESKKEYKKESKGDTNHRSKRSNSKDLKGESKGASNKREGNEQGEAEPGEIQ